jgi:uncharacterized membrane protein SirB2
VIEFYPQVRAVHIGAVLCSGALFAARGAGVLASARWPMAAPLRYLSYNVDTVLLTAALMLVAMLPSAVFANHWLTAKVVLLIVYVTLGSLALKYGRNGPVRAICFVAALGVFAAIVGIARTHQPLGWLATSAALLSAPQPNHLLTSLSSLSLSPSASCSSASTAANSSSCGVIPLRNTSVRAARATRPSVWAPFHAEWSAFQCARASGFAMSVSSVATAPVWPTARRRSRRGHSPTPHLEGRFRPQRASSSRSPAGPSPARHALETPRIPTESLAFTCRRTGN